MAIGITSLQGIIFDSTWLPYNISGTVALTDTGKAVSIDTTAANTVKLATAGDYILGRLETVEIRAVEGITVGTISRRFSDTLPADTAVVFAVGDTVVGSTTPGTVAQRKVSGTPTPDYSANIVVQVLTDGTPVVQKI